MIIPAIALIVAIIAIAAYIIVNNKKKDKGNTPRADRTNG